VRRRLRNWCQNEVYEETKEGDSRDKVKHNGRSDQLFLEMMMKLPSLCTPSQPQCITAPRPVPIKLYCFVTEAHVKNLPKVIVTRLLPRV